METLALRKKVDKQLAALSTARLRLKAERAALQEARKREEDTITAQELAQEIAKQIQDQAHKQIAGVVSRCLAAVFDDPYRLVIRIVRQRGRTEARLIFERRGMERNPLSEAGGGASDVAAFALRLVCLVLTRPPLRRFLVLDEPFRFVHGEENRSRLRSLLSALAEEFGAQFLIVTQVSEFQAGQILSIQ